MLLQGCCYTQPVVMGLVGDVVLVFLVVLVVREAVVITCVFFQFGLKLVVAHILS